MPEIVERGVCSQEGIGKPDYTREVSAGRERRGLSLAYLQTLKIFTRTFSSEVSAFDWVKDPLAPGDTVSLIDMETGFPMPFNVPLGYTATLVDFGFGLTADAVLWIYMSGFVILNGGVYPGGTTYYENRIQSVSTALIDPEGHLAPSLDLKVTNLGLGNLEGQVSLTGFLQAVGTPPPPSTKTVLCKWCEHEHTVPRNTTHITCPNCGKLFIVYDLSKLRGTP